MSKEKKPKSESTAEKVGSYLPIFSGFYNTIFEAQEDTVIEEPYTSDDYDFDYDEYNQDVAKACVKVVGGWLEDFDIKVEFEELISPKQYNYSNDSINVEYVLGKDSMEKILEYLKDNKEAFTEYAKKRYTSRSGFISSYSNDANEWIADLNEWNAGVKSTSSEDLSHKLGSVLEFILENEGHDEQDLYDSISGSIYLSGELKQEIKDNQEYIENYAKEHYKDKSQDEIAEDVMNHFNGEGIDYSEKTVKKIIKESFDAVEGKSMKMFEKGGNIGAGLKSFIESYATDGGLVVGGYFPSMKACGGMMEKGGKAGVPMSEDMNEMFDLLVEMSREGKKDDALDKMLVIANTKVASKNNLISFGKLAKQIKDKKISSLVSKMTKNIADGKYKNEFRFTYGGKKNDYVSSTTKEFFSLFEQAYTYHKFSESDDDAKLMRIAELIRKENTSGYDPTWSIEYKIDKKGFEMREPDYEHVAKAIEGGSTSGELALINSDDEESGGWWTITIEK